MSKLLTSKAARVLVTSNLVSQIVTSTATECEGKIVHGLRLIRVEQGFKLLSGTFILQRKQGVIPESSIPAPTSNCYLACAFDKHNALLLQIDETFFNQLTPEERQNLIVFAKLDVNGSIEYFDDAYCNEKFKRYIDLAHSFNIVVKTNTVKLPSYSAFSEFGHEIFFNGLKLSKGIDFVYKDEQLYDEIELKKKVSGKIHCPAIYPSTRISNLATFASTDLSFVISSGIFPASYTITKKEVRLKYETVSKTLQLPASYNYVSVISTRKTFLSRS